MKGTFVYTIDRERLFPLIEEEVSRVADETYADDGSSLYDAIIITSNDLNTIHRLEDDAVNTLIRRVQDICTYTAEREGIDEEGEDVILPAEMEFDVPDFDEHLEEVTDAEITRYIVLNTCAAWFQSRCTSKVEEYTLRGQVAMDKAVEYLKTIKLYKRR